MFLSIKIKVLKYFVMMWFYYSCLKREIWFKYLREIVGGIMGKVLRYREIKDRKINK